MKKLKVSVVFILAAVSVWGALAWRSSSSSEALRSSVLTVEAHRVSVIRELPHSTDAYTQGLLWHEGKLYESTGQYGQSDLRRVDPSSGIVEELVNLDPIFFGEGLSLVGRRLIQLTWKSQVALVYDLDTFEIQERLDYVGEGWGISFDGQRLVMSDGSDKLTFRDPTTFDELDELLVTLRDRPFGALNELEWANDSIYANVWQQDIIVRIDPASGRVMELIDASGLLSLAESYSTDVLNGIAYNPQSETFYITGKLWPKMFEVVFVKE